VPVRPKAWVRRVHARVDDGLTLATAGGPMGTSLHFHSIRQRSLRSTPGMSVALSTCCYRRSVHRRPSTCSTVGSPAPAPPTPSSSSTASAMSTPTTRTRTPSAAWRTGTSSPDGRPPTTDASTPRTMMCRVRRWRASWSRRCSGHRTRRRPSPTRATTRSRTTTAASALTTCTSCGPQGSCKAAQMAPTPPRRR
jgi:hypothetical protein